MEKSPARNQWIYGTKEVTDKSDGVEKLTKKIRYANDPIEKRCDLAMMSAS